MTSAHPPFNGNDSDSPRSSETVSEGVNSDAQTIGPQAFSHDTIGWKLFKNTSVLAVGRNINALCRLVVVGLIARSFGVDTFGAYSLIIALLTIAEWILDFGTTDVFVRDAVRNPQQMPHLRRVLIAFKLVQIPIAMFILISMLLAMRYPPDVFMAGLVGAAGLSVFAGVVIYRAVFKATLTMEREIVAEFLSILVMIPLVLLVFHLDGGLTGLLTAHLASRAVYFAACYLFGRRTHPLSIAGVRWKDVRTTAKSSLTIGMIGFLVVFNNTVEIVMLSRLTSLSEVALFSAAQKLAWPLLMALNAVGAAFYPVIATYWPHDRDRFLRSCQKAVDVTWILGGLALSGILCGAEFFMGLLGPDIVAGSDALRIIAIMCVVKAIAMVVGPVLFIVHAQRHALMYFAFALVIKVALIAVLAPLYGYLGVALITLGVELLLVMPATLYFVKRFTDFSINWSLSLHVSILVVVSVLGVQLLAPLGSFTATVLAVMAYVVLALSTRAVRLSELKSMLKREVNG